MTELEQSMFRLRVSRNRREAERKAARRVDGRLQPREPRNQYIRDIALHREPIGDGAELWITYSAMREEALRLRQDPLLATLTDFNPDALNGYVAFPKRKAPTPGGLTKFIPVHGGVTYACKDSIAAVWGFDTLHHDSPREPITDPDWIRANCHILYRGLLRATELLPAFERARNDHERAGIAQLLLDLIPEQSIPDKIGVEGMLAILFGGI